MSGFKCTVLLLLGLAVAHAQIYNGNCGSVLQGTIIADETNCNAYFVCNNGILLSHTCPNNQAYDATTQTCIQNGGCMNQISIDNGIGSGINWIYPGNMNPVSISNSNPCYGMATGAYVGHPSSCSQFYYCNNGQAYLSNCPTGYSYSSSQNACVYSTYGCYNYVS